MPTIVLGLLTALSYGFADFFAALAGRRTKVAVVGTIASLSGLGFLLLVSIWLGAKFSPAAIGVGLMGGAASVVALLALYKSLAIGPISIISPLGALVSAVIPVIIGTVWLGETLTVLGWLAVVVALVAVVLVSSVKDASGSRPTALAIGLAVLAGTGIALAITALDQAPADSGIATVIVMRSSATVGMAAFVALTLLVQAKARGPVLPRDSKTWSLMAVTGVFDACANVLFLLAAREGSLSVVGVLTALYPLGTIFLARLVLREKLTRWQGLGIALALLASGLLAIS
jgi:drug/metabolite transporter (DMT)-like permease